MNRDDSSRLLEPMQLADAASLQPDLESMTREQLLALIAKQAAGLRELQREQRLLFEKLQDRAQQEAKLRHMLDRVPAYHLAEQELRLRSAIAYDLHDGVGQTLAGARLLVEGALEVSARRRQPRLRRLFKLLTEAIEQLRCMARRLQVPDISEHSLADGLRMLAGQTAQLFKLQCTARAACGLPEPPLPAKTQAYLVAQEAVVNAARHSRGSCIQIELDLHDDRYRLRISDNGQGLPATPSTGLGLSSMKHRARMLGGTLELHSQQNAGTVVTLEWPVKESEPDDPPAPA